MGLMFHGGLEESVASSSPSDLPAAGNAAKPTDGPASSHDSARVASPWAYRLPILISLASFLVALAFLLSLRRHVLPPSQWIYWGAVVLTVAPGIFSRNRLAMAFGVGVFAFIQCFSYLLVAPYGIVYAIDTIYNMQLADFVMRTGSWSVGLGTGFARLYSYYPGSTLFHVALAETSGLPLSAVYLFGTGLLRFAVLPLTVYKIFRRFVGEFPTLIAVVVYLATPSYIFGFPNLQEFAIVLGFLALYATLLAPGVKSRFALSTPTMTAAVIFLATVAVSHYFTTYVFVFLFVALGVAGALRVRRRSMTSDALSRSDVSSALKGARYCAIAFVYIFVLWSLYVSSPVDLLWLDVGTTNFTDAFGPNTLSHSGGSSGGSGVRAGYTYTSLEILLMVLALALIALSAFLGAVIVARRSHRGSRGEKAAAKTLLILFLLGVLLGVAAAPLWFSSGVFVPLRILEFANLGLAPLSGVFFVAMRNKRFPGHVALVAVAVALLVVGGSLVQTENPRFYYVQGPNFCDVPSHLTPDVVTAALWAEDHINSSRPIIGDGLMLDAFGGYAHFQVNSKSRLTDYLFNSVQFNASYAKQNGLAVGDIVVVDTFMTSTICFPATRATPTDPASLAKFSTISSFALLFQNDVVSIYRWDGLT